MKNILRGFPERKESYEEDEEINGSFIDHGHGYGNGCDSDGGDINNFTLSG